MKTVYKTIIVGIDDTDRAMEVLDKAIRVARESAAKLIVVSTIPYNQIVSIGYAGMDPIVFSQYVIPNQDELTALIEERKIFIKDALQELDTTGIKEVQSVVEINDADTRIVELAEENPDALIVIGSSDKKTIERFILGSVARQILHTAPVDVLLVKTVQHKK
jgi:Universal stress protein UspA and related nucleotide-binding proteins